MKFKKLSFWATFFPTAAILLLIPVFLILFRFLPNKLPLFYSLRWGENQLADHFQFFILPAVLAIFTLVNMTIATYLHEQQAFFKKVLSVTTIFSTVVLLITVIKIIFLFL